MSPVRAAGSDRPVHRIAPEAAQRAIGRARVRLLPPLLFFAAAFTVGVPWTAERYGPWATILLLGAALLVTRTWMDRVWTCPACQQPLGRWLRPRRCPNCAQEIFADGEPSG